MGIPNCQSSLPYPPVIAECKNPMYAQAMLSNMGSGNSEISAISSYFYSSLITAGHDEISQIFHKISVVEMHHLKIFGEFAYQLGADPRLWASVNRRMVYWSPQYIKYPNELKAVLSEALSSEMKTIEKYTIQSRRIKDLCIVENLKRIILDEEIHVDIFKTLLSKC